ncbi:Xaa-Pro peptidase family protein [Staphylococcus debuckii]|uniref:Xaa-Pro peptidase family protein n=1 Tax=Staphylococcus debuckii TaxID=2044912 RepID=A0ABU9EYG0_9STAP
MNLKQRLINFRKYMKDSDIDLSIIINFENQMYFTGFKAVIYSRPIILLITQNSIDAILPELEKNNFEKTTGIKNLHVYSEVKNDNASSFIELLKEQLSKYNSPITVGIEENILSTKIYKLIKEYNYTTKDIGDALTNLRTIKSEDEKEAIKLSSDLVSNALKKTIEATKPGMTELQIDSIGNEYLFNTISKEFPEATFSFFVMSPSGKRTTLPHTFSNVTEIKSGDIIIHSRQVELNGYRSECERTFVVDHCTKEQARAFNTMVKAHQAALDFIKVGVKAKEVDQVARKVFEEAGYGEYINHRTGHGIGIGQHEEPSLRYDNELVLEEGMVFCVEPAIYIPGIGGFRHSDTVALNKNGTEVLTSYPHNLSELTIK